MTCKCSWCLRIRQGFTSTHQSQCTIKMLCRAAGVEIKRHVGAPAQRRRDWGSRAECVCSMTASSVSQPPDQAAQSVSCLNVITCFSRSSSRCSLGLPSSTAASLNWKGGLAAGALCARSIVSYCERTVLKDSACLLVPRPAQEFLKKLWELRASAAVPHGEQPPQQLHSF